MLAINSGFFVQLPTGTGRRVLCPATVTDFQEGTFVACFEDEDFTFAADQEVLIFFEHRREFMQQAARIQTVTPATEGLTISFETTGDPVSAESRQCFRVSTVLTDLFASFGEEEHCDVLDISMTGCSIVATTPYPVGSSRTLKMQFDGQQFTGSAVVQSIREIDGGRFRYGLHCAETIGGKKSDLTRGLQSISVAIQRLQLRRQAGAA
jgi:PilZ domain